MRNIILKRYYLIFFLTFSIYSLINWYLHIHYNITIQNKTLDTWIPAILIYGLTFFIFRPLVKKSDYTEKVSNFILWCLIPFTIWLPIALSQNYFRDISYNVIKINTPYEVWNYPKERFFRINSFVVEPSKYFLIKERHTSGKYGSTLNLNNYYIIPMYSNSTENNNNSKTSIGYGVKISTTINNGLLFRSDKQEKTDAFMRKSELDFKSYKFYDVGYFERIKNNDDERNFLEAETFNPNFEKSTKGIVLLNRSGTIQDLYRHDRNVFLTCFLICLAIGTISFYLINRFQKKPSS